MEKDQTSAGSSFLKFAVCCFYDRTGLQTKLLHWCTSFFHLGEPNNSFNALANYVNEWK